MRYNIAVGTNLHIIGYINIDIRTQRVALIVKALQHTLLIHIVARDIIGNFLGSASYGNIMILDNTSLRGNIIHPVVFNTCGLVLGLVGVLHIIIIHGLTSILGHIVLIALGDLCTIGKLQFLGKILNTQITVVADGGFLILTTLGRNENNTVGTVGTIDSGGSCILQDLYRLDIVGVDIVERTIILRHGNTINNNIRSRVRSNRVLSTD